MDFTLAIMKMKKSFNLPSQKKNAKLFFHSTDGEIVLFPLSVMIHSNVLVVEKQCFSWNYIIIISIFLWTKCMKGLNRSIDLVLLQKNFAATSSYVKINSKLGGYDYVKTFR